MCYPVLPVSISAESNVGSCPYGPRRSWHHNSSLMFNDNRWKTAGLLPTRLFSIFILKQCEFRQHCWQLWCCWWGKLDATEVPEQAHSTPFVVTFSCFASQIKYISGIAQIIHHRAIFTALRRYREWLKNKQFITLLQFICYSAIKYTITRQCHWISGRLLVSMFRLTRKKERKKYRHWERNKRRKPHTIVLSTIIFPANFTPAQQLHSLSMSH